ncbi:MAG: hypothetical protein J6S41_04055, partial [Clostridia bacterium]|nr:hypothetical protein [Clostridia bacterium]
MEKRMTIWRVQLFALMRVLLSGFRVRLVNPNGGYRSVGKKSSGLLSRLGGIGVILLLACAAVSVMFMLGTSFYTLVEPLHLLGLDWMYMSLVWIVCAFVMLFGTVFLAKAMLYEAKDNARLLVMPISPTVILCARMLSLYLLNLIWGAFVLCPALVCRFWLIGFSMGILIRSILIYLLIGLFSLALSGLLGWVLARISAHIRNKSLVTVVLSLAFIGAYYYCVGTGFSRVMELLLNESHAV